jgi:hypothetical protein
VTHPTTPSEASRAGKIRVHELAKELGVESKVVLRTLQEMGEFVKSASSIIEAPVARRLRDKLRATPPPSKASWPPMRARHWAQRDQKDRPGQPFLDPEEAAMARALGVASVPRSRGRRREPLQGLAKTMRDEFPQIRSDDEARTLATQWTDACWDTEAAVIQWARALGPYAFGQAARLATFGIKAQHLDLTLRGRRVADMLRGGESITRVAGLLRQEGHTG